MPPQHPGSGPPHYLPDLFPHFRPITVDRALITGWFLNFKAGLVILRWLMLKRYLIIFGFFLFEEGALLDPL